MGLSLDVSPLERSLIELAAKSEKAITTLCQAGALDMEAYMKTNRP